MGDIDKVTTIHVNRLGRITHINKISPLEFTIKHLDLDYMRISREGDNVVMFDPSGGPCITAECSTYSGTKMEMFDSAWKDLIVEKIEFRTEGAKDASTKDVTTCFLKCRYTKPIEWIEVK